jgi:hypothetical protein
VIALGVAGAAFERGSPPFTAPIEEVVAFWSTYQRELLAQSLMFVLSAEECFTAFVGEPKRRHSGMPHAIGPDQATCWRQDSCVSIVC